MLKRDILDNNTSKNTNKIFFLCAPIHPWVAYSPRMTVFSYMKNLHGHYLQVVKSSFVVVDFNSVDIIDVFAFSDVIDVSWTSVLEFPRSKAFKDLVNLWISKYWYRRLKYFQKWKIKMLKKWSFSTLDFFQMTANYLMKLIWRTCMT